VIETIEVSIGEPLTRQIADGKTLSRLLAGEGETHDGFEECANRGLPETGLKHAEQDVVVDRIEIPPDVELGEPGPSPRRGLSAKNRPVGALADTAGERIGDERSFVSSQ